jgi:hypothetical protein
MKNSILCELHVDAYSGIFYGLETYILDSDSDVPTASPRKLLWFCL